MISLEDLPYPEGGETSGDGFERCDIMIRFGKEGPYIFPVWGKPSNNYLHNDIGHDVGQFSESLIVHAELKIELPCEMECNVVLTYDVQGCEKTIRGARSQVNL